MRGTDPRVVLGLHRSRHERRLLTAALDLGVTALDTSTSYLDFRSHQVLVRIADDLLPKFTVSTKVGYFSAPDGAEHSLDPHGCARPSNERLATWDGSRSWSSCTTRNTRSARPPLTARRCWQRRVLPSMAPRPRASAPLGASRPGTRHHW